MSRLTSRRELGLPFVAAALGGFAALLVWAWPFTMDDAFISFRYAKHIGDGVGPVWNPADVAQPVEGFTSFLHVWLLGGLRALTRADMVATGKWVGVAAGGLLALVMVREIVRRRLSGLAAAFALSPMVLPFTALHAVSGMETGLAMLLLFACPVACLRLLEAPSPGRIWGFVLLGLLATLTRPEYGASFAALLAWVWWRRPSLRRRLALATVGAYVLPGLLVTAWRYATYGDLVPHAFHVKQGSRPNRQGVIYVARFAALCALPYGLAIAARLEALWRSRRDLLTVTLLAAGVQGLYFSTTAPLMGWWYRFLLPQIPLLALCAAVAVSEREKPPRASLQRAVLAFALGALVVLPLFHAPLLLRWLHGHTEHETRYRELGRRLHPFAKADRWLVYHDVGALVFEAEWNVVDVVGLNTRRERIRSPCAMKTDVVLRSARDREPAKNPCPELYVEVADLPFAEDPDTYRHLAVFVRRDVNYGPALGAALADGWPAPLRRGDDWLLRYWRRFARLAFQ